MGHLKTFFAQGVDNLISQISKSSNSRVWPGGGGGGVMLKFRIDRYINLLDKNKRLKPTYIILYYTAKLITEAELGTMSFPRRSLNVAKFVK